MQKEKCQTLMTIDFMSSEESQASSGSDRDLEAERSSTAGQEVSRKLVRRPLPWRSEEASQVLASLDRKYDRKQIIKGEIAQGHRVSIYQETTNRR